jgi:glutamate formiminotransferase
VICCVVNVSEGRDGRIIEAIAGAGGDCVLDVHSDPDHHRTVLTMAGAPLEGDSQLEDSVQRVARRTVELVDLRRHRGVHPRLGSVDVVPFVPLDSDGRPQRGGDLGPALDARRRFATWAGRTLALPCFFYGPGRTLPEVRRRAFAGMEPDAGPAEPHPTAGACAVGARTALMAYNLWLSTGDPEVATSIAAAVRGPSVRALGLAVAGVSQVSCNLTDPWAVGPAQVYDAVERLARDHGTSITRAELVGLAPAQVVDDTPRQRWAQLDIDPERTLEARLQKSRS